MPSKNQLLGIPSPQEVTDRDTAPSLDTSEMQEDQPARPPKSEDLPLPDGKLPSSDTDCD